MYQILRRSFLAIGADRQLEGRVAHSEALRPLGCRTLTLLKGAGFDFPSCRLQILFPIRLRTDGVDSHSPFPTGLHLKSFRFHSYKKHRGGSPSPPLLPYLHVPRRDAADFLARRIAPWVGMAPLRRARGTRGQEWEPAPARGARKSLWTIAAANT